MITITAVLLAMLDAAPIEDAVRAAFPPRITELADKHRNFLGELPDQRIAFERVPGGTEILAAYGDGTVGVVRLLDLTKAPAHVIAESDLLWSGGPHDASIRFDDLDGDGTSEYLVSYPDHRLAERIYIFRRSADRLILISPQTCSDADGTRVSDMLYPDFVDLDGDGKLEAVDRRRAARGDGGTDDDMDWILIWKLVNGVYTLDVEGAPFFHEFRRSDQQPAATTVDFPADIPSAEMIVVNGGFLGAKGRASSAEVRLNGSVVLAEKNFKQSVATFRLPVKLQPSNELSVRIAGAPDSQLIVYFVPTKKSGRPCRDV